MFKNYIQKIVKKSIDEYIKDVGLCDKCGGYFKKSEMKRIDIETGYYNFNHLYCSKDAPPYDRKRIFIGSDLATLYFKDNVNVDEEGKPLTK